MKAGDYTKEFTQYLEHGWREKAKVMILSWNMGNAEARGLDIVLRAKGCHDHDIVAIGLQESTYTLKNSAQDCFAHLTGYLDNILGPEFYIVERCHRAQLQLFIYAKMSLKPRISNLEKSIENTGLLHVFPNKGGLLVTFDVDGTRLAFISCHLTAHEGKKHCAARNASIIEILGGVRAGDKRFDVAEQFHHVFWMGDMNYRTTYQKKKAPAHTKKNRQAPTLTGMEASRAMSGQIVSNQQEDNSDSNSMSDVDAEDVDLTMRNSEALRKELEQGTDSDSGEDPDSAKGVSAKDLWQKNYQNTLQLIVEENWSSILDMDELGRELSSGRVMNGFQALKPAFPPTFKRSRNLTINSNGASATSKQWNLRYEDISASGKADQFPPDVVGQYYDRKRLPSFTDRILYKSFPAFVDCIRPLFFQSGEEADSSDHKPVAAAFEIQLATGTAGILVDRQLLKPGGFAALKRREGALLRLVVRNLRAYNLEEMDSQMFGGGSDPYVVITSDPPSLLLKRGKVVASQDGVKSKVILHELNPVWTDELEVMLASGDIRGLAQNASLLISVWDEDKYNADDLIGVVALPLRDILKCFLSSTDYDFAVDLRSCSEIMGRLSGTVTIASKLSSVYDVAAPQTSHISLAQAVAEAGAVSTTCSCVVN